jgi:hypothetical protein
VATLVRIGTPMQTAMISAMTYIRYATGREPAQAELAAALSTYFMLNEISNQLKFQHKKTPGSRRQAPFAQTRPFWTLDLLSGPSENSLARAGYFIPEILEAIEKNITHAETVLGHQPEETDLAACLQSSFILSELKNQIEWLRKNPDQAA